jgi:hypothetical protein
MQKAERVSVPIEPGLLGFTKDEADREGRSVAGQLRFWALQAWRRSGAHVHHGELVQWPPVMPPLPADLEEARAKLAELEKNICALEEVANPKLKFEKNPNTNQNETVAQVRLGLTLQQEDLLKQLRNRRETLRTHVELLERSEAPANGGQS